MQLQNCTRNAKLQLPTVPNILKPSPLMGEGWVGGDVRQTAARDPRVSEIWSIPERRTEHEDFFEVNTGLLGSDVLLCGGTVTPPQALPHRGGGLLRS